MPLAQRDILVNRCNARIGRCHDAIRELTSGTAIARVQITTILLLLRLVTLTLLLPLPLQLLLLLPLLTTTSTTTAYHYCRYYNYCY